MVNKEKDALLEGLLKKVEEHCPRVDLKRVRRAYEFAKMAHKGQFRMSGKAYITHPVAAAIILAELGVDEDSIITALLHDVPEDTSYTVKDVQNRFGKSVSQLVDALTKLSKVYYKHSMGERQVDSLRRMFLETAKDPRVVIVKLADRLHNMSTLQYLRPEKQKRIASETMEIFVPLSNLYGIFQLRRQLEDYCFKYLQPDDYERIQTFVHDHEQNRTKHMRETIRLLKKNLDDMGIQAEFQGRPKHFYSIYQKAIRDKKILSDIYDYFAVRIITENNEDCYRALGLVHSVFKPKPNRFKDYIAIPKANGYQSLHSTVVGFMGKLTEIQIRTKDMHKEAEFGSAAHGTYKKSDSLYLKENITKLGVYKNPEIFIQNLQEDLLQNRIYVFSPSGDAINLPEGASCLDYVYAVDLPVNTKSFRARVNKKPYSLMGVLQSGDYIEIIYGASDSAGPERWWLDHVKTAKAKEAILSSLSKKSVDEKREIGSLLLQQELDHESSGTIYYLSKDKKKRIVKEYKVKNFDSILTGIGEGTYASNHVYRSLFPNFEVSLVTRFKRLMYYIKQKAGMEMYEHVDYYHIRVMIKAHDRVGLLQECLQPAYDMQLPLLYVSGKGYDVRNLAQNAKPVACNLLEVSVVNHEQLLTLFDRIEKIPGVIRVYRVFRKKQILFFLLSLFTALFFSGHFLLLRSVKNLPIFNDALWSNVIVLTGFSLIFTLFAWLRSMGNKTFPQFEETKYFWPMSFGLIFFAVLAVYVDYLLFEINLHLPSITIYSIIVFGFLFSSYRNHRKRQERHLSRLKSDRKKR
jgi:guanosine-3',5'-bis(diphosphate) 3'-pyrophosphohydrolase